MNSDLDPGHAASRLHQELSGFSGNRCSIAVWSAATSLNTIAGLPAPAFFLGFPPESGVHDLGFHGLDYEDGRLFLADQHAPNLNVIERNIDQHEFAFGGGGVPCLFAIAKNNQQVMGTLRVGVKSG